MIAPNTALEELHRSVIEERRPSTHAVVAVTVSHNYLVELLRMAKSDMAHRVTCEPGCLCALHAIDYALAKL